MPTYGIEPKNNPFSFINSSQGQMKMSDPEFKNFLVNECNVSSERADQILEWEAELERQEMDKRYRQMNRNSLRLSVAGKWMDEMFDED